MGTLYAYLRVILDLIGLGVKAEKEIEKAVEDHKLVEAQDEADKTGDTSKLDQLL